MGSSECRETRGKPLNKYEGNGQSEDEICGGCRFFDSKPEATPPELIEYVNIALAFSETTRGGGHFAYPDALDPLDWACIAGLTRGRDRADGLRNERERKERRRKERTQNPGNG